MAIGVLTQTTAPSWGAWVTEHNATTLFEMWGAFEGGAGQGTASHNHVMFSSFMPWLFQTVVGVAMDDDDYGVGVLPPITSRAATTSKKLDGDPRPANHEPTRASPPFATGYSTFRVAPRLLGDLSAASATLVTMRGNISVSWARLRRTVWLNVTLPLGADTAVTVPLPRERGCGPAQATVWEGAGPVWQHGAFNPGVPGIASARVSVTSGLDGVQVTAGSGEYVFSATC